MNWRTANKRARRKRNSIDWLSFVRHLKQSGELASFNASQLKAMANLMRLVQRSVEKTLTLKT